MKRLPLLLAATAFGFGSVASAYDPAIDTAPTAEAMALDLVLMRPLSLAGTVLGTAVFIVSLPIDLLSWNFSDPARRLVLEPAEYTFIRPLGDLD